MDHKFCAQNNAIVIRPLCKDDIEKLRIWRNDSSMSFFLHSVQEITPDMQLKWYEDYLSDNDTLLFSVIDKSNNNMVGSVALYGFKNGVCSVGKIVIGDISARGKGIGYGSLLLAMTIAFTKLSVKTIKLNVHEDNQPALSIYEKAGFNVCGKHDFDKGGQELEMELNADDFFHSNDAYRVINVSEDNVDFYFGGVLNSGEKQGKNCIISKTAIIEDNVILGHNCIIEDDVTILEGTRIDSNAIIRRGTRIGKNSFVGSNCIIGEYLNEYIVSGCEKRYTLTIGENAIIRSGSIIYTDSVIGDSFQTGHQVTIREKSLFGNNVSIGTLSDIQGFCKLGNYVRLHSNVHIGQHSVIDDFVWIFPYVVLTNDPTPPSEKKVGVHIYSFAIIATGALLLPGVVIGQDALIGAGAVVTKDIEEYKVAVGNPAKEMSDVRKILNRFTGEPVYPWRYHFGKNMPWEKSTFNEWIESLDEESKGLFTLFRNSTMTQLKYRNT